MIVPTYVNNIKTMIMKSNNNADLNNNNNIMKSVFGVNIILMCRANVHYNYRYLPIHVT